MKKLHVIMLTLLMLLVGVVSINAKDKKEEPVQCVITLQNGDKVSGYVFNVKQQRLWQVCMDRTLSPCRHYSYHLQ